MYRISVTVLETFRRYLVEASPFDTEERLLESIKGIFVGNPKTQFGTAFHCLLEGKYKPLGVNYWAKGLTFTEQQAAPAFQYRNAHTDIVSEVNVSKVYETNLMPIQVCGRVDALEGLFIRDGKTKFRNIDWQEYLESCQWKFYLDMLQADAFYYDVFEVVGFPEEATMEQKFYLEVMVRKPESIQCTSYAGMSSELHSLLNDFLDYITNRNLWQFLKPALINESILD